MGNTDGYLCDSEFVCDFLYLPVQSDLRLAVAVIYNFYIRPGYFPPPACSYQFQDSLFGCKTAGIFFHTVPVLFGVGLLFGRENPVNKALIVPLYHLFDTWKINKVDTVRQNSHPKNSKFETGEKNYRGFPVFP
jgi:hypothetical protein